jgi:hypothetical protein
MQTLFLLLVIIFAGIIYFRQKENFDIKPFNYTIHDTSTLHHEKESEPFLDKALNSNKSLPNQDNYKKVIESEFIWNSVFKNVVSQFLGPNIRLLKAAYNITYKDTQNNERKFIFNIDAIKTEPEIANKLIVFLTVKNVNNYIDDTGEYNSLIQLNPTDITIDYITLSIPTVFKTDPYNYTNSYYYTLNRLYLLDPFPSSSKYMKVDPDSYQPREPDVETPRYDFQCPFNRANKNYPNNFGKVLEDKCQLPLNMQPSGFNDYSKDPQFAPLCYNCKEDKRIGTTTLGMCCNDQSNKELYPNLVSPDFAYENDKPLREKYKDMFLTKNLEIV